MAHKGIVKGNAIELESEIGLPDGTEVEILVREALSKGSPQAVLSFWDTSPLCTTEDVAALLQEIEQGKRDLRFDGIFEQQEGAQ